MEKRVISTELVEEDIKIENNLRPLALEDYIGQEKVKRNLKVYIEAAKARNDSQSPMHKTFYFYITFFMNLSYFIKRKFPRRNNTHCTHLF